MKFQLCQLVCGNEIVLWTLDNWLALIMVAASCSHKNVICHFSDGFPLAKPMRKPAGMVASCLGKSSPFPISPSALVPCYTVYLLTCLWHASPATHALSLDIHAPLGNLPHLVGATPNPSCLCCASLFLVPTLAIHVSQCTLPHSEADTPCPLHLHSCSPATATRNPTMLI